MPRNYKSFKGINLIVLEIMHQFIMGGRGGGTGRATQSVRGSYTSFKVDKCDGFGKNAPVYHIYPVSRTTSE